MLKSRKKPISLAITGLLFWNATAWAAPVDLTLADSIVHALQNNPAIKMAASDREKAQWSIREAEGAKLPSLSLGSSYTESGTGDYFTGANDSWSNSLRLNWQLYSGGRTESQISQAKEGLAVAAASAEKTEQQLRLDTTVAYFSVLQARNAVRVNQETADSLRRHLANVQAKYEAGVAAKSDVLRSEVELANAQQNLTKAQSNLEGALVSLNNIMGYAQDTELALKDELSETTESRTLAECLLQALKNRPEIQTAEANINIAQEGREIARSGRLPAVNLSGTTGWNDSFLPDNSDNHWSVGIAANWNIFDGNVTKARIRGADAAWEKAGQQVRQIRDNVEVEVRQAYLSMEEAYKRIDTTKTAVAKAEEDVNISQVKYNAGAGTNIEVMDAQLALTQTKMNYAQALYDFNVSKAKLNRATGTR